MGPREASSGTTSVFNQYFRGKGRERARGRVIWTNIEDLCWAGVRESNGALLPTLHHFQSLASLQHISTLKMHSFGIFVLKSSESHILFALFIRLSVTFFLLFYPSCFVFFSISLFMLHLHAFSLASISAAFLCFIFENLKLSFSFLGSCQLTARGKWKRDSEK